MSKPKLSVYQAINKSLISLGIKPESDIRVYYQWDMEKRKKPLQMPFIMVDYNKIKREWYIYHVGETNKISSCTVDDITGTTFISNE